MVWKVVWSRYFLAGLLCVGLILLLWPAGPVPDKPFSKVLYDARGELLSAQVAADEQWRFPLSEEISPKLITCLLQFEDRRFHWHPGIDPLSLLRATWQNISAGHVVSGGSTLTMQLARIIRGKKERTYGNKLLEMILALRMETGLSKKKILQLYLQHAPFGGNVVGLEAACWHYLGKDPAHLSWGEAATLAILPNQPGLVHPGRNPSTLRLKRNHLLIQLYDRGIIDSTTMQLAVEEAIFNQPRPMPLEAPHLLQHTSPSTLSLGHSTLDGRLQVRVNEIVSHHLDILSGKGIHNAAVLIGEVASGRVLAYAGNDPSYADRQGTRIDMVRQPRSLGSTLKPLLYALAQQDGLILPHSLLRDVPTKIHNYYPQNFSNTHMGVVAADRALIQSLNVPMILLLRDYGLERFYGRLKQWGLTSLSEGAEHYGLTLIVGGAEATLWDLCNIYRKMAYAIQNPGHNTIPAMHTGPVTDAGAEDLPPGAAAGSWLAVEAMSELQRPDIYGQWQSFSTSRQIAWKTGTSFGLKDAWAVGVTPDHFIGIWIGNASNEGRPDLIGSRVAAPLLFELFDLLPPSGWFEKPGTTMEIVTCTRSGYLAGPHCEQLTIWAHPHAERAPSCPYHSKIFVDEAGIYRVHKGCFPAEPIEKIQFVLPPVETYYRRHYTQIESPLPWHPQCSEENVTPEMELIYPVGGTSLVIPVELSGEKGMGVFKCAHRREKSSINWYVDGHFLGKTTSFHEMAIQLEPGSYLLTLVDDNGSRISQKFSVVSRT